MPSSVTLLLLVITAALVVLSMLRGALSASSLISIHLFLGISVRAHYLNTEEGGTNILAPWILIAKDIPVAELAVFLLAYSSVWIMLAFGSRGRRQAYRARLLRVSDCRPSSAVKLWLVLLTSLSIYFGAAIKTYGSLDAYIVLLASRVSEAVSGFAYYAVFADLVLVASVFIYFCHRTTRSPSKKNQILAFSMFVSMVALLFLQGGRGNLIQYLITLLIIRQVTQQERKSQQGVALLIVPIVVAAVAVAGLSVRLSTQNKVSYFEAQQEVTDNLLESTLAPFALVDHYMIAKKFVESHGHDFGYQYLSNFVKPIPRSLWQDKPKLYGIQIREMFWNDSLGGIPPGYIGEAYIAFGLIGLVIAAALLAFLAHIMDVWYRTAKQDQAYAIFYAIVVPYVAFNLIRGGIDIAFMRIVIMIGCFILMRWVLEQRMGTRRSRLNTSPTQKYFGSRAP